MKPKRTKPASRRNDSLATPTRSRPRTNASTSARDNVDWLVGGGEMGKVVQSMDWSRTPLGPIETWPQSLRTTVSLCLASNFPLSIAWGPKHIQIYNDGYWPICGAKHPHSMGQDFSECWASAWPVIGEPFERALVGETSFLENQRIFLDRNGYVEETFFTFSFSPIRDESGGIGGLFHPVTETTSRMLSERRARLLRDLTSRSSEAQSIEQALSLAAAALRDADLDLPFVLIYLIAADCDDTRLVAHTGIAPGLTASPLSIDLASPDEASWPLAEVIERGENVMIDNLDRRFADLRCGPYPESPKLAMAMPVRLPGAGRPLVVIVAGVSARLPLTETYRAYLELVAAAIATSVANAHAYEATNARAEALAEIDRAKTAFFSNVSHEFRTPLTLMLGPLEDELAQLSTPLVGARRERLELAHRNALRLLKLVNTLLDFSRIEASRLQASYEPTDLAARTAELASVFRSAIERAGLTLSVDCPPLSEPVHVDRDMWEKIVLNLLSNALKHTFAGGIEVRLREQSDSVQLAVQDSGIGISAEEMPRLFDRFYRVKGAKSRSHEGTGIGLSLVQELARLHGGEVTVASDEGAGSTFTVSIKKGIAHLEPERLGAQISTASTATRASAYVDEAMQWLPQADAANASTMRSGSNDSGPSTADEQAADTDRAVILWVDDNADMREYVRRLLADRYDVITATDGQHALELVREHTPELVLSDVMMPRLDGFGLLRALRADPRTRTTPVILLSARAGEESALDGLAAGADDYLAKPFSARELLARVRTHLELARLRRSWADELARANQELEAFVYSVSHDLRSPLRAIDGFSRLTLEDYADILPPEGRQLLERICKGATRMGQLIDDLLEFSRVSRRSLNKTRVDTTRLMHECIDELRHEQYGRRVEIALHELPPIEADVSLLQQVLVNLLSNALKYSRKRETAHIEIGCKVDPEENVFFVHDDGVGFDMRYADRLFGVFERLHKEGDYEGTGVGLAIVKRIVERHGGRIWAESQPGAGATFFFTMAPAKPK